MHKNSLVLGLTGPSTFTKDCIELIEEFYGANVILLYQNDRKNLRDIFELCDGLILAGGVDIHPRFYSDHVLNGQNIYVTDIERDKREIYLIELAKKANKPILGLCRGHQLLAVTEGLKTRFITDISDEPIMHSASNEKFEENDAVHSITILNREIIQSDLEKDWVNSFHHQAICYLKNDPLFERNAITPIAIASVNKDLRIIEAMSGHNWISCQWHAEFNYRKSITSRLILEYYRKLLIKNVS